MLGELWLSRRNERVLLSRGAIETPDPAYATMKVAYPGVFVLMAVEGAIRGTEPGAAAAAGVALFAIAKAFKFWAIGTLGTRWTYKVLVLPAAPLVAEGPYRLMRHPNYLGVLGELVGMALLADARWTGPASILFFSWLLWRRIAAEERALHLG
jgi:methyltransferase